MREAHRRQLDLLTFAELRADLVEALALLKPASRTIVLCGHVHGYFVMTAPTGVRIVAAPSLASSREQEQLGKEMQEQAANLVIRQLSQVKF